MNAGWYLTLRNADTDEVLARYPMSDGEEFSVGFIHSVNKSPFIDTYRVSGGDIMLTESIYYAFGAGVETILDDSYTFEELPDGGMLLGNMQRPMPSNGVVYIVGTYSDHTLILGDLTSDYENARDYIGDFDAALPTETPKGLYVESLSALDGRNASIQFTHSFRFWG